MALCHSQVTLMLCTDINTTETNFVRGASTDSIEENGQREPGSGDGSPLVRISGGSCNLVQEISFHIIKLS